MLNTGMGLSDVNKLVDTYKGNPQPLAQKLQQSQKDQQGQPGIPMDLELALAYQKIKDLQDAAKNQQSIQAGGPQPTVVDHLKQMLSGDAEQGQPQEGGPNQPPQFSPQPAAQGQPPQGGMPPPQGAPQGAPPPQMAQRPPMPQAPVRAAHGGGIDQLMANLGRHYDKGGIVAFAEAGGVKDPNIAKTLEELIEDYRKDALRKTQGGPPRAPYVPVPEGANVLSADATGSTKPYGDTFKRPTSPTVELPRVEGNLKTPPPPPTATTASAAPAASTASQGIAKSGSGILSGLKNIVGNIGKFGGILGAVDLATNSSEAGAGSDIIRDKDTGKPLFKPGQPLTGYKPGQPINEIPESIMGANERDDADVRTVAPIPSKTPPPRGPIVGTGTRVTPTAAPKPEATPPVGIDSVATQLAKLPVSANDTMLAKIRDKDPDAERRKEMEYMKQFLGEPDTAAKRELMDELKQKRARQRAENENRPWWDTNIIRGLAAAGRGTDLAAGAKAAEYSRKAKQAFEEGDMAALEKILGIQQEISDKDAAFKEKLYTAGKEKYDSIYKGAYESAKQLNYSESEARKIAAEAVNKALENASQERIAKGRNETSKETARIQAESHGAAERAKLTQFKETLAAVKKDYPTMSDSDARAKAYEIISGARYTGKGESEAALTKAETDKRDKAMKSIELPLTNLDKRIATARKNKQNNVVKELETERETIIKGAFDNYDVSYAGNSTGGGGERTINFNELPK